MTGNGMARLRQAVGPAAEDAVLAAASRWYDGAAQIDKVVQLLDDARPVIAEQLGPRSGPAAARAFAKMSERLAVRRRQMDEAATALVGAQQTILHGRETLTRLEGQAMTDPGRFTPDPGRDEVENLKAMRSHNARVSAYQANLAAQDAEANRAADEMDRTFTDSSETMKKIHGEPDRQPSGGGDGTSPGGSTTTPGGRAPTVYPVDGGSGGGGDAGGHGGDTGGRPELVPDHGGGQADGDGHQGETPSTTLGVPQGPSDPPPGSTAGVPSTPTTATPAAAPSGATLGGVAGALGGGVIGGAAGIGGAVRGGTAAVASSAAGAGSGSGARAIGSTTRAAGAGTLGRGTTSSAAGSASAGRGAAAGSTGGSTGSRAGAGRSAGASGTAGVRGARGAAGGRGAGGAAGRTGTPGAAGRAASKRDEEKKLDREFYEDAQDWVDDEDAAPGVLG